ncbi:MAG: LysR family transcriptional regulator [Gammaproteobacteria bacterium]|nr:LysR family transcriptional regulator [Gammaproteobacteria bacterium]
MSKITISKLSRRISIRQLQVFEAVSRLKSYTQAAEELYLTQPTVSMQIKKLESDIGLPLIEQVAKKLSLTEIGKELLITAHTILESLGQFEAEVEDQKGLRTGHLHFAVVSTANYFAPRLLGLFRKQYPGIKISLEVTNRMHILERMQSNSDDIYLIGKPPESSELKVLPYLPNPLVVVAPVDHKFAKRKKVSLQEISKEPLILREQGSGTREAVESKFTNAGLTLNIGMELGNNESIKQGISGGLGIAVLSLHTLTSGDMHDLTVLDVEGFPISWQWYISYPRNKRLSIAAKTFIEFMFEEGPLMQPDSIVDSSMVNFSQ